MNKSIYLSDGNCVNVRPVSVEVYASLGEAIETIRQEYTEACGPVKIDYNEFAPDITSWSIPENDDLSDFCFICVTVEDEDAVRDVYAAVPWC